VLLYLSECATEYLVVGWNVHILWLECNSWLLSQKKMPISHSLNQVRTKVVC